MRTYTKHLLKYLSFYDRPGALHRRKFAEICDLFSANNLTKISFESRINAKNEIGGEEQQTELDSQFEQSTHAYRQSAPSQKSSRSHCWSDDVTLSQRCGPSSWIAPPKEHHHRHLTLSRQILTYD